MDLTEQKILAGQRITTNEAHEIYQTWDLLKLGEVARELSRQKNGAEVGYIIDRNINYTNVCVLSCDFCNFYRRKSDHDSYTLSFEALDKKIEETLAQGGTGILMQGGHHPDYGIEWYEGLLQHIRRRFPGLDIHAFSPPEIYHFSKVFKRPAREILTRFKEAGLTSIPGGGGEILVDRVRKIISPGKVLSNDWLDISATAHGLGIPTSATMMFGYVETWEERLEHLEKIREVQDRTHGFFAFIPWTYQPPLVGSHEYLRMLALSRIFLDNFRNIQVSWLTQGVKVGQVGLQFGANDMGSVMIEENVVSQSGAHHTATADTLRKAIREAGFIPHQRNSCYAHNFSPPGSIVGQNGPPNR